MNVTYILPPFTYLRISQKSIVLYSFINRCKYPVSLNTMPKTVYEKVKHVGFNIVLTITYIKIFFNINSTDVELQRRSMQFVSCKGSKHAPFDKCLYALVRWSKYTLPTQALHHFSPLFLYYPTPLHLS